MHSEIKNGADYEGNTDRNVLCNTHDIKTKK